MANFGQYQQDASATGGGGAQAVVELHELTADAVVFWSRRLFQIGTELLLRLRRDSLPAGLSTPGSPEEPWTQVHGYVVECRRVRRPDGSQAFKVVLILESALAAVESPRPCLPCMDVGLPGVWSPGLN